MTDKEQQKKNMAKVALNQIVEFGMNLVLPKKTQILLRDVKKEFSKVFDFNFNL